MNERGVVGSQERVGGGHLLRLPGPAERDPLARVLPLELVPADTGGNGRVQRRADLAGAQGVDPDPVLAQFHGHRLGEQQHPGLGGVVVGVLLFTGDPVRR